MSTHPTRPKRWPPAMCEIEPGVLVEWNGIPGVKKKLPRPWRYKMRKKKRAYTRNADK